MVLPSIKAVPAMTSYSTFCLLDSFALHDTFLSICTRQFRISFLCKKNTLKVLKVCFDRSWIWLHFSGYWRLEPMNSKLGSSTLATIKSWWWTIRALFTCFLKPTLLVCSLAKCSTAPSSSLPLSF